MIYELPFDVLFKTPDGTETVLTEWTRGEYMGRPYFESALGDLQFAVQTNKANQWYLKVSNWGKTAVTGYAGIRFSWTYKEDGFTLVPGIYYDGNYHEFTKDIPYIHLPEKPVFAASLSAATFPTVLVKDGVKGFHYDISPTSLAGWNGVALDAVNESLTIYAPAWEENYYLHTRGSGFNRPPYTWEPRSVVCVRFSRNEFDCAAVTDLFDHHWEKAIRSEMYPAFNTPKISEEEGSAMVRDWVFKKHCVITEKDEPLILNAFMDVDADWPRTDLPAEWHIMIGWCDGTMTALPLLKYGGKYRDFAIKFFDFLSTHGDSPSGVKFPIYDGNSWMTTAHPEFNNGYRHCRFYGDHLHYLGKAIRYEKANGHEHPAWEADFAHGMDVLMDIWEREKDFGMYWDIESEKATIYYPGTAGGAFVLSALAEGCRHYPENERLAAIFQEACGVYYENYVKTGRSHGGPSDILDADDSESIAALTDALTSQYQLFGKEEYLEMALDAAKIFATWCVNYQPTFPGGSTLEGINVCGGVLANVQNRHVGPGICTNSARFVYDLGQITGDQRWTDLYFRIKAAALNCLSTYDGEFYGGRFNEGFAQGMISEQINMTNSLSPAGETWRVSACWPASAILLGWYDTPEN